MNSAGSPSHLDPQQNTVFISHFHPKNWVLRCPNCGGALGPSSESHHIPSSPPFAQPSTFLAECRRVSVQALWAAWVKSVSFGVNPCWV